jgi:hypothetical protein
VRGLRGAAKSRVPQPHVRLRSGDDVGVTGGASNVIVGGTHLHFPFLKHE